MLYVRPSMYGMVPYKTQITVHTHTSVVRYCDGCAMGSRHGPLSQRKKIFHLLSLFYQKRMRRRMHIAVLFTSLTKIHYNYPVLISNISIAKECLERFCWHGWIIFITHDAKQILYCGVILSVNETFQSMIFAYSITKKWIQKRIKH